MPSKLTKPRTASKYVHKWFAKESRTPALDQSLSDRHRIANNMSVMLNSRDVINGRDSYSFLKSKKSVPLPPPATTLETVETFVASFWPAFRPQKTPKNTRTNGISSLKRSPSRRTLNVQAIAHSPSTISLVPALESKLPDIHTYAQNSGAHAVEIGRTNNIGNGALPVWDYQDPGKAQQLDSMLRRQGYSVVEFDHETREKVWRRPITPTPR